MTRTAEPTVDTPYIPPAGIAGKAARLRARFGGRRMRTVRPERGLVSISFDDFPKSAAEIGAAEVERVGARATYYACGGFAGRENHHGAMFDGGDLRRLIASGHEIGGHTHDHVDCARAAASDVLANVEKNADALRALGCDQKLRSFAFPYGEAAPGVKTALQDRFANLRGVRPGMLSGRADFNMLPAHSLDGGEAGLARVLAALDEAAKSRAWLILFTHDVREDPTPWGCTPAMLRRALETAKGLGLEFATVGDAADRFLADA